MYEVIGYRRKDFTVRSDKDGKTTQITGLSISLAQPAVGDEAAGMIAETVYVSDAKLAANHYQPVVGDHVNVYYNRFGKLEAIQLA